MKVPCKSDLCLAAYASVSFVLLLALASASHASSVIASWDFDASATMLTDGSGNGNTLTSSDATWSSDVPAGSGLSGSVLFNGVSSTMETVSALDLSGYSSLRISWWQKVTGTSTGMVFEYGSDIDSIVGAFSHVCNNNDGSGVGQTVLRTLAHDPNNNMTYNMERYTNKTNSTWEYIVTEIDLTAVNASDVIKIWQDGNQVGTEPVLADPPAAFCADEKFYIGHQAVDLNANQRRYFTGYIAGLTIENIATVPEPMPIILLLGALATVFVIRRR